MKEKWEYNSKYLIFYFAKRFNITFEICGYFDNRPRINISLFFFSLTLIFPFENNWTDECDPPTWGVAYHDETLWFYLGGKGNMNGGNKWITFDSPFSLDWVRSSYLKKDMTWEDEYKGCRKSFYDGDIWKGILFEETHPYIYILKSGKIQERLATIKVQEMEWRMNWFKWLSFTKKVRKTIDVTFNDEVGERSGSWKGGTIGCSYEMLPNETPYECLKRMEKERNF
jgi:hypothetical protein